MTYDEGIDRAHGTTEGKEIARLNALVETEIENWKCRNRDAITAERQRENLVRLLVGLLEPCKGEHLKFEAWAASERYDMQEHPLHYLFTDPKTYAARQGWKAALRYIASTLKSAPVLSTSQNTSEKAPPERPRGAGAIASIIRSAYEEQLASPNGDSCFEQLAAERILASSSCTLSSHVLGVKMAEHTPTPSPPWRIGSTFDHHLNGYGIYASGCRVAVAGYLGGTETAKINAAFIVKAVNNHDALVAALVRAREAVNAIVLSTHSISFDADLRAIDTALAGAGVTGVDVSSTKLTGE